MRASLCIASIVFGLSFATLPVMAQHGGHGGGHVGGVSHVAPAPAHFYGGSGGMHAPVAPMHMRLQWLCQVQSTCRPLRFTHLLR